MTCFTVGDLNEDRLKQNFDRSMYSRVGKPIEYLFEEYCIYKFVKIY